MAGIESRILKDGEKFERFCFYNLRDDESKPVVTVCLLKDLSGIWSRGISVCHECDNPCRQTGMIKAYGRAFAALSNKRSSFPSRSFDDFCGNLELCEHFFYKSHYKSHYNTIPNTREMELLKRMGMKIKLGYEQLRALYILRNSPGMEGSEICGQADCSFRELLDMAERGLVDPGFDRIMGKQVHPTITREGLSVLAEAEKTGLL